MQFRDLKAQYEYVKDTIDKSIQNVINQTNFIQGKPVRELEEKLSEYVGTKHCITCANGTDALQLALMAWNIGVGDAVFVPDFTFFSSGEVVAAAGATPIFVDVEKDTFNISLNSLVDMIRNVTDEGRYVPKAVIAVDLFGQPADYENLRKITEQYGLLILEDGAQGFGGRVGDKRACSFGDISTTSFFPAKPLGCYGDGGAIFTDNDEWADLMKSYRIHGKGSSKYDNVRIGMNSRLDTIQAAILLAKFPVFAEEELEKGQIIAERYTNGLREYVKTPYVKQGYYSSWAQYTIQLLDENTRDGLQGYLWEHDIPSMIYYQKPMHRQEAFISSLYRDGDYAVTNGLCETVLSLPFHPYLRNEEVDEIVNKVIEFLKKC